MDQLWAPWRMKYISVDKGPTTELDAGAARCIFCDKPREDDDAANLIIARGETCYVILNAFPYNNGHLMVVPYRHISHPAQMNDAENAEIMQAASRMTTFLDGIYKPDGYNIGINVGAAAGAGIAAHLHLHIVPRWGGDTNYMTVIGETRILPEMLTETYGRLTNALAAVRSAEESAGKAE